MSSTKGPRRGGLGKGLSALLGSEESDYAALDRVRQIKTVPVEMVRPGKFQPRRRFDDASMAALVDSVKEKGVLQPLLVRRHPEAANMYEIVAGERRWRAAQAAKLHEIPVVIRELEDREALEVALIENIQRADLTPLEEADGYKRLMDEFGHTQEALAQALGKSRSHVANMIRLLGLPTEVKEMLEEGLISAGHARTLLTAEEPAKLAHEIASRGLSVRDAEALAQETKGKKPTSNKGNKAGAAKPPSDKDPDTRNLERDLTALLGLKVTVEFEGKGGALTIHYSTLDQLDEVLKRLRQK
jgi:ParB family chromosome partitioning protein